MWKHYQWYTFELCSDPFCFVVAYKDNIQMDMLNKSIVPHHFVDVSVEFCFDVSNWQYCLNNCVVPCWCISCGKSMLVPIPSLYCMKLIWAKKCLLFFVSLHAFFSIHLLLSFPYYNTCNSLLYQRLSIFLHCPRICYGFTIALSS